MKIVSLIPALVATAALTALGQEGVVQDVKHGAKKAGETIKDGLETVGQKTKETAKTVGKKTKETAETVGEKMKETGETVARKTKETVDGTGEKAAETTRRTHHKSSKTSSKAKAQTTEEQTTKSRLKCAGTEPEQSLITYTASSRFKNLSELKSRRSFLTCSHSSSESYLAR